MFFIKCLWLTQHDPFSLFLELSQTSENLAENASPSAYWKLYKREEKKKVNYVAKYSSTLVIFLVNVRSRTFSEPWLMKMVLDLWNINGLVCVCVGGGVFLAHINWDTGLSEWSWQWPPLGESDNSTLNHILKGIAATPSSSIERSFCICAGGTHIFPLQCESGMKHFSFFYLLHSWKLAYFLIPSSPQISSFT